MKGSFLAGLAAAVFALGMSGSALAFSDAPSAACGPHNYGATTSVSNLDGQGHGTYYVYTCYADGWLLTETWYCDYGGCIVM